MTSSPQAHTLEPTAPPAESLLSAVAQRELHAVEECISRYGGLVLALARRLLNDASEVEEAVQDVFAEIWSCAHRYNPKLSSEKTFIAMIARRRLIDRRRRRDAAPRIESLPEPAVLASAPDTDHVERQDEIDRVLGALQRLKPQQKQVIKLAIVDGWSHQRIAAELGQPLGTIKSNIRRGLMKVREMLGGHAMEGGR